jgi:hypothetical protein
MARLVESLDILDILDGGLEFSNCGGVEMGIVYGMDEWMSILHAGK